MTQEKTNSIAGIILAAGKGTRMKSDIPKVLHEVNGKTMVEWVADALSQSQVDDIVLILNHNNDAFTPIIKRNQNFRLCIQENQKGTGDAVAAAAVAFNNVTTPSYASRKLIQGEKINSTHVVICAGDTPAIKGEIINDFIVHCLDKKASLGVLGINLPDPTGYGRLVTSENGKLEKIVEHKDATDEIKKITSCNSGIIFAETDKLFSALNKITPNNTQNEYYLTDCIEVAQKEGLSCIAYTTENWKSFSGVNTPEQKEAVEQYMKSQEG